MSASYLCLQQCWAVLQEQVDGPSVPLSRCCVQRCPCLRILHARVNAPLQEHVQAVQRRVLYCNVQYVRRCVRHCRACCRMRASFIFADRDCLRRHASRCHGREVITGARSASVLAVCAVKKSAQRLCMVRHACVVAGAQSSLVCSIGVSASLDEGGADRRMPMFCGEQKGWPASLVECVGVGTFCKQLLHQVLQARTTL
jgi:hypothetical protein